MSTTKRRPRRLPKRFQGAEVWRGLGMKDVDAFLEKNALDSFDATRDAWLVIEDGALADLDDTVEVKAFGSKADAVRYARARSNGNVDHRVLRVTEQVIVVATMND
jgi:hypothetical protein